MRQQLKVFFGKLIRLLIVVGLILLFLPHLTKGTISVVTGLLDDITSEEICDETQVIQAIVSEVIPRSLLVCAEYTGVVSVQETLPAKFLGLVIFEVTLFKQFTGCVTAVADLEQLDLDNGHLVHSAADQALSLVLPLPAISSCVLNTADAFEIITPDYLPLSCAQDIAIVDDALIDNARSQLIQKALSAGIIREASNNLCSYVETLILECIDPSIQVTVRTERRNEHADPDPMS